MDRNLPEPVEVAARRLGHPDLLNQVLEPRPG